MSEAILENYTYNLTNILSTDIIDAPNNWLAAFNHEMMGFPIITMLLVIGVVLFIGARSINVKDSEAAVYSGLIISFVGLLLFFIDTGNYVKLITWTQEFLLILITAIAILMNKVMKRY